MKKYLPSIIASTAIIFAATAVLIRTKNFTDTALAASVSHLVISEVQIGVSGTGNADNDFVELYNPTGSPVDLNGFRLVKRTATGSADQSIKAWDTESLIPANGFYLWANDELAASISADTSTSATLAANNGVALRQGLADTGTIIDSVAWGEVTNTFVEATAAANPALGGSIERKPCTGSTLGNSEDNNNNLNDFVQRVTSEPQNSQSAAEVPDCASPTASPTSTATASPTATSSPTSSPTASPTATASPTSTPSSTPTSTPTVSPTATTTSTATPTSTSSPAATVKPTHRPFVFACRMEFRTLNFGFFSLKLPFLRCF